MSALLKLAARVEAATGPDRELDLRIEAAVNPEYAGLDEAHANFLTKYGGHPRYTASLDAAMTLVPEGAIWEVGHKVHYPRPPQSPNRANYAFVNVGEPGAVKSFNGKSVATPALALCAAALRALAAGTRSAETNEDSAQSEGCQSGPKGNAQTPPGPSQ